MRFKENTSGIPPKPAFDLKYKTSFKRIPGQHAPQDHSERNESKFIITRLCTMPSNKNKTFSFIHITKGQSIAVEDFEIPKITVSLQNPPKKYDITALFNGWENNEVIASSKSMRRGNDYGFSGVEYMGVMEDE